MEAETIIHIVGTQPRPEVDEKFNTWYSETHIPMLLKFRGLKEATRYKRISENEEYPKYLTMYKFESQKDFEAYDEPSSEVAAAREEMKRTWKEGEFEVKWRVQYEPIKTWKR